MKELYLGVNEIGDPIIGWKFNDKDLFDKFGKEIATGFANVSDEEENDEYYVLFKDYGSGNDYSINIFEEHDNVFVKVIFNVSEGTTFTGRCKKNKDFFQFIKAYHGVNTGNIRVEITSSHTQLKKHFHTFAFTKNEFATIHRQT